MWDAIRRALETELGEPITIDALTGAWRIAQRERGHRHSVDDVLTADFGAAQVPDARTALDLGTGIGGVGLLVKWRLRDVRLTAIEAQELSFRLFRANLEGNGLTDVTALHGDLRSTALPGGFDLITGSPPYFPVGTGVIPADPQKAHARFELRGDVADYCAAAQAHLAPAGTFCFCFPTPQRERALAGIARADLHLTRMRDIIPRATRDPLFTLFAARHQPAEALIDPPFVVRDEHGVVTAAMEAVRTRSGF